MIPLALTTVFTQIMKNHWEVEDHRDAAEHVSSLLGFRRNCVSLSGQITYVFDYL
jgi:hypothetical protein